MQPHHQHHETAQNFRDSHGVKVGLSPGLQHSWRHFLPFSSLFTSPSLSIYLLYSNFANGSPRPFNPTLYCVNNSTEPTKVSQLRSTNVAWKREDEKQTMKLPLSLDAGILIILAGDLGTLQSLLFIVLLPVKSTTTSFTIVHSIAERFYTLFFVIQQWYFCGILEAEFPFIASKLWISYNDVE